MRKLPIIPLVVVAGAAMAGGATTLSIIRFRIAADEFDSPDRREQDLQNLAAIKKAAVEAGALETIHNLVYERVGEERWEGDVKPEFLSLLMRRVAFDTGNPAPTSGDILGWLRAHPDEARMLMERAESRITAPRRRGPPQEYRNPIDEQGTLRGD